MIREFGHEWRSLPLSAINGRLARLGRQEVPSAHRGARRCTGILVVEPLPARTSFFWSRREKRWISVEDYFIVRHGLVLKWPNDWVISFREVFDDEDELSIDNLFPIEMVLVG
uniref:DUF2442 domain-containing protein n=1 Tax=Caenorhabditis tropicalis TaxID=1561998 RepID=A0A1I7TC87_9PELO